jgi:hypothetical protein
MQSIWGLRGCRAGQKGLRTPRLLIRIVVAFSAWRFPAHPHLSYLPELLVSLTSR